MTDAQILRLLKEKNKLDLKIKNFITKSTNKKVRFSEKKFVGDLGEYYFFKHASTAFSCFSQNIQSNATFDFEGTLRDKYKKILGMTLRSLLLVHIITAGLASN